MRWKGWLAGMLMMGLAVVLPVNADDGSASFPSPDGVYVVKIVANKGQGQRHHVEFREVRTNRLCRSYDPQARAVEALWNGASSLVALNEDISHATGALSLWKVAQGKIRKLALPAELTDSSVPTDDGSGFRADEVINRYVAAADRKEIQYWQGAHQPSAVEWITGADLKIDLVGVAEMKERRELNLQVQFMIRVTGEKILLIQAQPLKYVISAEK